MGAMAEADEEDNIDEEESCDDEDDKDTGDEAGEDEGSIDEHAEDTLVENDTRWCNNVPKFLDFIGEVPPKLCMHPGSVVSVDKMMRLFKGWSGQTHRMKNEPIKEGCKFFSLCDTKTGFACALLPDG